MSLGGPAQAGPGRAGRGGLPLHGDVTAGDVASPGPARAGGLATTCFDERRKRLSFVRSFVVVLRRRRRL